MQAAADPNTETTGEFTPDDVGAPHARMQGLSWQAVVDGLAACWRAWLAAARDARVSTAANFVLGLLVLLAALALACHLLALSARDRWLAGEDTAAGVAPLAPADYDARRIEALDAHVVVEHEDGSRTVLRRGLRTAENALGAKASDWWNGAVLDPLVAAGFVDAMMQVDPWLTPGRFAPRRLGITRDCADCPALVILGAGWLDSGDVWWHRAAGAAVRRFEAIPELAIMREPCGGRFSNCSGKPGEGAGVIPNPAQDRDSLADMAIAGYRILTPSELIGLSRLASSGSDGGLGLVFPSGEWACDIGLKGAYACQAIADGVGVSSTGAKVRYIRSAATPAMMNAAGRSTTPAAAGPSYPQLVFIQFAGILKREEITALNRALAQDGWRVQSDSGERTVAAAGFNEVRYSGANAAAARALAVAVNKAGLVKNSLVPVATPRIEAGRLEIWMSR